jgi:hypothetical protein
MPVTVTWASARSPAATIRRTIAEASGTFIASYSRTAVNSTLARSVLSPIVTLWRATASSKHLRMCAV